MEKVIEVLWVETGQTEKGSSSHCFGLFHLLQLFSYLLIYLCCLASEHRRELLGSAGRS